MKTKWIIISVMILIVAIIVIIYLKNRKFLKATPKETPGKTGVVKSIMGNPANVQQAPVNVTQGASLS